jgi:hypothetical protein
VEIIIFSVLLVVGALVLITTNAPGYFPAVNAHASATKHQRSQKNIQRLEHELEMCVSGCPHHRKPPPPAVTVIKEMIEERERLYEMGIISTGVGKHVPRHRVPRLAAANYLPADGLPTYTEPTTEVIKDGYGDVVAMLVYDDLLSAPKMYPVQRPKGQVPPGKILR